MESLKNKARLNEHWKDRLKNFFPEDNQNLDNYIISLERKAENDLKIILLQLEVQASVKTDPYSLPFQKEIITKMIFESYVNGMFEYYRSFRPIVKKLLDDDIKKIRFYFYVEGSEWDGTIFKIPRLIYKFRYYVHE